MKKTLFIPIVLLVILLSSCKTYYKSVVWQNNTSHDLYVSIYAKEGTQIFDLLKGESVQIYDQTWSSPKHSHIVSDEPFYRAPFECGYLECYAGLIDSVYIYDRNADTLLFVQNHQCTEGGHYILNDRYMYTNNNGQYLFAFNDAVLSVSQGVCPCEAEEPIEVSQSGYINYDYGLGSYYIPIYGYDEDSYYYIDSLGSFSLGDKVNFSGLAYLHQLQFSTKYKYYCLKNAVLTK